MCVRVLRKSYEGGSKGETRKRKRKKTEVQPSHPFKRLHRAQVRRRVMLRVSTLRSSGVRPALTTGTVFSSLARNVLVLDDVALPPRPLYCPPGNGSTTIVESSPLIALWTWNPSAPSRGGNIPPSPSPSPTALLPCRPHTMTRVLQASSSTGAVSLSSSLLSDSPPSNARRRSAFSARYHAQ